MRAVIDRDLMKEQGSPSAVDLFKNLTASGAVIGETNSWFSDQGVAVPESVANVNLRGLGASRTLVLINSRRQVQVPARLFGGRFVDVNMIPGIAIDRIEVLKEGAAAVYGSDAVAGVGYVNHISSYDDAYEFTAVTDIGAFLTVDLTFLWNFPDLGFDLGISALNLMDEYPPLVDFEQSFDSLTHNVKGRRLKAAITYRFGS